MENLDRIKQCTQCKVEKPLSEFYKKPKSKDGVRPQCIICTKANAKRSGTKNLEKRRVQNKAWLESNPDRYAIYLERKRAKTYGLTEQDIKELYVKHNAACAICFEPETSDKKLCIDHCHSTGKVRGLLCATCNLMLGKAGDCAERLSRAVVYLKASEKVS